MFALFQFGTIAKQASCQLDCSFYITVYFFHQLQNIGFQLIVSIHPANPIHTSCQDGYLFITMYSFYQMHPARMVAYLSRSIFFIKSNRLGWLLMHPARMVACVTLRSPAL